MAATDSEETDVSLSAYLARDVTSWRGERAARLAERIVARHGDAVAAVLFYGSCLRTDDPAGILDVYVLVDGYRRYHGSAVPAAANAVLPPNVSFWAAAEAGAAGAKVTVMSRRHFLARLSPDSLDTTVWARFCQPVALVHARDEDARRWTLDALARAVETAVWWGSRLGPEQGRAADLWMALFQRTYGAELRVETAGRAADIYGFAPARFDALLRLAAPAAGLAVAGDGTYMSASGAAERGLAERHWNLRRRWGKVLNLARLAKALFTFAGGLDYIVWKLERHSGQRVHLSPWQRRHPLLAAPSVLLSLYRRGIIR